jgi:hypothetical protein
MYVYTISKAVERGYIPKSFSAITCKGYQGVLSQLSLDADGEAHIANICEGTNVGNLDYYLQRARKTDDFHGLGAFLIMNEQIPARDVQRANRQSLLYADDPAMFNGDWTFITLYKELCAQDRRLNHGHARYRETCGCFERNGIACHQ